MKRATFIVVLLALIIGYSISSYAATNIYYNDYAVKLSEIGVFKGTGSGFELEREPTRLEGLIMLIRLLGKENVAIQLKSEKCVFADVPEWGRGYANYAYKNGLAKGIGNNLFGAQDKIDGKSYITFLLRSLGYNDSGKERDFTWSESIEFAKSIGLLDEDLYFKIVSNTFIRDYIAKSSYNTLQQPLKDGTSTLIQKLVSSGIITQSQAESLSFVADKSTSSDTILTSIEIGKLADAVVLISAVGYDGSEWTGSGFYTTQDGNIVTNYHVIDGAKTLTITENDGQVYSGSIKVIGYNANQDIAVLDIDKTVKLYIRTGNSDKVVLGEEIYAIGSPLGLKNTVSDGIVSSLRDDLIQISAPISHGSSGGVLLNNEGLAIGITFAGIEAGENLGFAIPINQYINMDKNLSLDLASFYNLTLKVQKPSNIVLSQTANDTFTVYWDKVDTADYYRVYFCDSVNGVYLKLTNNNGSDKWSWSSGYCISINNLKAGSTYFVKVVAVKGTTESQPSDIKAITLTGTLSYEEYQTYLLNTYGSFSSSGYTTGFREVNISESTTLTNTLYINFYLDNSYFTPFLDMMLDDKSSVESKLASIASEISKYYDKDVSISIIYTQSFSFYPTPFLDNNLYSNTITFNNVTNEWFVFYPYINIYLTKGDNTYISKWAY